MYGTNSALNVKANVPALCFCCVLCVDHGLVYNVLCAVYGANRTSNVKGNIPDLCFCCVLCVYRVLAYKRLCAVYGANSTLKAKVMSQLCAMDCTLCVLEYRANVKGYIEVSVDGSFSFASQQSWNMTT